MSTPAPHATWAGGGGPGAPGGDAEPRPDQFAVSPAIGPLPATYVAGTPGQPSAVAILWRPCARALRLAGGWVIRRRGDGAARR
jgi:hypothetical protein